MIKNFRDLLALVMLGIFCSWLALIGFWLIPMITTGNLDPMMALIAGLGIGGVTNALLILITLVAQFYFRKANVDETVQPAATPNSGERK